MYMSLEAALKIENQKKSKQKEIRKRRKHIHVMYDKGHIPTTKRALSSQPHSNRLTLVIEIVM